MLWQPLESSLGKAIPLCHFFKTFWELSTQKKKKLRHFQNNFDVQQINGISFVLQASLYDGGLYNPYSSRTVSLNGEVVKSGEMQEGTCSLTKKKSLNLTCNYCTSCDPCFQLASRDSHPRCEKVPASSHGLKYEGNKQRNLFSCSLVLPEEVLSSTSQGIPFLSSLSFYELFVSDQGVIVTFPLGIMVKLGLGPLLYSQQKQDLIIIVKLFFLETLQPSEYSYYSSRTSSARSSPVVSCLVSLHVLQKLSVVSLTCIHSLEY